MKAEALKAGAVVAVNVPDELPDPTDAIFGFMRDGVLEVMKVLPDCCIYWRVLSGTAFHVGCKGTMPMRYAPYLTVLSTFAEDI